MGRRTRRSGRTSGHGRIRDARLASLSSAEERGSGREKKTDAWVRTAARERKRESMTGGASMSGAQRGRADRWAGLPKRKGRKGKVPERVSFIFFF